MSKAALVAAFAILAPTASLGQEQVAASPKPTVEEKLAAAPKATVDADGTVHLPAIEVPFSSLASEEAKQNFLDTTRSFQSLPHRVDADGKPVEVNLDEHLFRPGVAKLRAAFPVEIRPEKIAGVQTDIVEPADGIATKNKRRVLINLHGGGFIYGARYGGQMESIPIAALGAIRVITVDYRQSPKHKFPAASEDVASVYQQLLKTYSAGNVGIYGCSAGGQLTAQAMAWFQKEGLPLPGAIGMFGAGAMMDQFGDSNYIGLRGGPIGVFRPDFIKLSPYFSASDLDLQDPLVSPVYAPSILAKFPPSLLISGTRDLMLSPVVYTHSKLVKAGVPTALHVWEGAPHCSFAQPVVNPKEPESLEAWDVIVKFFDSNLGK